MVNVVVWLWHVLLGTCARPKAAPEQKRGRPPRRPVAPNASERTVTFSCADLPVDLACAKACFVVAAKQLGLDPASLTRATPAAQKRAAILGEGAVCWAADKADVPALPACWPLDRQWVCLHGWGAKGLPHEVASAICDLRGRFVIDRSGGGPNTCKCVTEVEGMWLVLHGAGCDVIVTD